MTKQTKPKAKEVTIFDVAAKAGVSISTVSMVMRGSDRYSDTTKKAVRDAVRALRYQPNIAASNLSAQRTNLIAVCGWFISKSPESLPMDLMLKGIMEGLKETRYALYMVHWSGEPSQYRPMLRSFSSQRFVSGAIWLVSGMLPQDAVILKNSKIPVVQVESVFSDRDSVSTDNERGAYLGARHLLESGRRRIALLTASMSRFERDRVNGCKKAFQEMGVSWSNVVKIGQVYYDAKDGYRAGRSIVAMSEKGRKVDAVFSLVGDRAALGAMQALKEAGFRVPEDVAVVGYDGMSEGAYSEPTLTTIEQPLFEMGLKAASTLIARIENSKMPFKHIQIPSKLIHRRSS